MAFFEVRVRSARVDSGFRPGILSLSGMRREATRIGESQRLVSEAEMDQGVPTFPQASTPGIVDLGAKPPSTPAYRGPHRLAMLKKWLAAARPNTN